MNKEMNPTGKKIEKEIWEDARINQDLTLFITKKTIRVFGSNVDAEDLPRIVREQRQKAEMWAEIYQEWKRVFGGSDE